MIKVGFDPFLARFDMRCTLGWVIQSFFKNFNNGVLNFYAYWSKNPSDIIFFLNLCLPGEKFVNAI